MKKTTKKSLAFSIVAMLLCLAMLVGTTFAWFTDSVTSDVNKIVAGNLDVEATVGGQSIQDIKTLFNDVTLWEPGAVAYENITVKNNGNLALMYKMSINFTNENTLNGKGLSKALKVGVVKDGVGGERQDVIDAVTEWLPIADFIKSGVLKTKDAQDVYGVVIYWEPTANDNDFNVNNGKKADNGEDYLHIDLGINILATQYTYEEDSFDETYDAGAISELDFTDDNNNLVDSENLTNEKIWVIDAFNTGMPTGSEMPLSFKCYTFDATKFTDRYPVETYKDYVVDFWVSTDKPLELGTTLVGNYEGYGWIGFNVPQNIDSETDENLKYEPTPLLHSAGMGDADYWNYKNIVEIVKVFKCGIAENDNNPDKVANEGTKVTVELRMTNPENASDYITITSITETLYQA